MLTLEANKPSHQLVAVINPNKLKPPANRTRTLPTTMLKQSTEGLTAKGEQSRE